MADFAAIILAHTDPLHVQRLVNVLEDVPLVLHCDAKTPGSTFAQMTDALPQRVTVAPRISAALASWSLVEAEIEALRIALRTSAATHIGVLSGTDYPLVSMNELAQELGGWEGQSWFPNAPVPHEPWNTRHHHDGGLWRFRYRYLTRHGHVKYVGRVPLRWPVPRKIPEGLALRAASQWKIFARHHVETLLRVVDTNPDMVRFWRSTLVPDESFAASILASPKLTGEDPLPTLAIHPWFFNWDADLSDHPNWLGLSDLPALEENRRLPSMSFREACVADVDEPHRRFFARKFSTAYSAELLDVLDGYRGARAG